MQDKCNYIAITTSNLHPVKINIFSRSFNIFIQLRYQQSQRATSFYSQLHKETFPINFSQTKKNFTLLKVQTWCGNFVDTIKTFYVYCQPAPQIIVVCTLFDDINFLLNY